MNNCIAVKDSEVKKEYQMSWLYRWSKRSCYSDIEGIGTAYKLRGFIQGYIKRSYEEKVLR